jgi:hypothetical protein
LALETCRSQGDGFFYLVRAKAACRAGTFDSGSPAQQESRDAEVNAAGPACP